MKGKIDKQWFVTQLRNQEKTATQLSKYLKLDPSAVSRMLNSERRMTMAEAAKTAHFLGQPVTTVMERAGIPLSELNPRDTGMVRIFGTVDADGRIDMQPPREAPYVQAPPDLPAHGVALRLLAEHTPQEHAHGWVVYYEPTPDVPVDAIGRLCVVHVEGDDTPLLRIVKRSIEPGKFKLVTLWGHDAGNGALTSASPILWIKT